MLRDPQYHIDADGTILSEDTNDVYFSRAGGLEESRYVFIEGNDLPARFTKAECFVIGETGFGTGLNFLATWECWHNANKPEGARLEYISLELAPFSKESLSEIYAQFPDELQPLAKRVLAAYPLRVPGYHRLELSKDIALTLIFGAAEQALKQLRVGADAWFLDGFAPAKNPDMWSTSVCRYLAENTKEGGTFSTFTAARVVRDGLAHAGYKVAKIKGFGRKRDMLIGRLPKARERRLKKPWFHYPPARLSSADAIVIGGGIAGCSAAYSLAKRGLRVTLLEREGGVGRGASGNRAGVFYPVIAKDWSPPMRFYLQALSYIYREFGDWLIRPETEANLCGVLRLRKQDEDLQYLKDVHDKLACLDSVIQWVDNQQASELAGVPLEEGGLFFPHAGWVNVPEFCDFLCSQPNITKQFDAEVMSIEGSGKGWKAKGRNGETLAESAIAVIATAHDAARLLPDMPLGLQSVKGQTSFVNQSVESASQRVVLCQKGYVTPALGQLHVTGSTYEHTDDISVTNASHNSNLNQLAKVSAAYKGCAVANGWSGVRTTTTNRLPLAGQVPEADLFQQQYKDVLRKSHPPSHMPPNYAKGLFLSVAHGSRGLLSAPLIAEDIAARVTAGMPVLPADITDLLHPARTLFSQLQQEK